MAQMKPAIEVLNVIDQIISHSSDSGEPFFLFDLDSAAKRATEFMTAAEGTFPRVSLRASIKSCNIGLFCERLQAIGYGAEVCSLEEAKLVERAGFSPSAMVFDGPMKTDDELSYCLERNVLIQVDGLIELKRICQLAAHKRKTANLLVRLTHLYKDQGYSRFGLSESEFSAEAWPLIRDNDFVKLEGFHFNFGSNLASHAPIVDGLSHWIDFLNKWMPANGVLDLGSGFPADSFSAEVDLPTPEFEKFFLDIREFLSDQFREKFELWTLVFEPGRILSEDFGYLVGRIVDCKWRNGIEVLQSNLAVNWVGSMHTWHHLLQPVGQVRAPDRTTQFIAGFNCFEQDYLTAIGSDFKLRVDDWFYVKGCGAYDLQTMAQWTRNRPTVYAWVDGRVEVARLKRSASDFGLDDIYFCDHRIDVDERLALVQAHPSYAEKLYAIIEQNRESFSSVMHWPRYSTSVQSTRDFLLRSQMEHQDDLSKTYVVLSCGMPCGMLSFHEIDRSNQTAYIGYWLNPEQRGSGIITKAVKALMAFHGSNGCIQRFVIKVSVHNDASNRVAQRCGFELEGTLKRAEKIGDRFVDQNIYGLLMG